MNEMIDFGFFRWFWFLFIDNIGIFFRYNIKEFSMIFIFVVILGFYVY